jgi:hypothetical protein
MKTKTILLLLFICIVLTTKAQPQKGTWEIGGSGLWSKNLKENEVQYKVYNLELSANYFIFKYLSLGGSLAFKGYQERTDTNNAWLNTGYFKPNIEAYLINRKIFGISIKTALDINLYGDNKENSVSSFSFGPKFSWNITPNLSTNLWFAYRKLKNFDTTNIPTVVPSDNFDIRWGFSYYLHRKTKSLE